MNREDVINQVMARANVMRSAEADFEKRTWTFTAPSMVVSGGEYVIVPKTDWDAFISNLRVTING